MPNRLAGETSPYLRQHAANPVDWYPWGDEALGEARARDKPILLSIGYSSCHWCHVMERESFENEETARLMNENFVNIKVDREERPDLDHIYMEAVQAITGRGGWPLTVFLTPAGDAYFGGTYFPPQDVHGLPSFRKILIAAAEAYRSERTSIQESADAVRSYLEQLSYQKPQAKALSDDVLKRACSKLSAAFDKRNGGFGEAPRFPQPMVLEFLLRYHLRTVAARRAVPAADRRAAPAAERMALEMVETSLERMARGGIYDQLGGGFHRYSTDAAWLVPHFEKMLYDNALLSRVYLHAYQVTAKPLYRSIAEGTLEYVLREMTAPGGGFCSAQDADTEGEEGKYYLWTPAEIEDALGSEQAGMVSDYFGVTGPGNYEGKNVLHVAGEGTLPAPAGDGLLEEARSRLLAYRERRVRPGRDDKVLAGWNGLMMA
ncbi:MAG: thioredoxin domain-containing protein, partial [Chloroflexi bacterium]|nr:thioredoxin domain-containing protein [Chloroflexota bacterium]